MIKKVLTTISLVTASLLSTDMLANDKIQPLAHIASPDQYEVLLENEHVLVLKMVLEPGEADTLHSHNDETVYFERGGKLKITEGDGNAPEIEIPDGFVMWHQAWTHQVTNTGSTEVVAIIVESKK